MNIKEAKQEIINTLKAYHKKDADGRYTYPLVRQRPILLMGPPGIGKTAVMEQIAAECGVGLVAYTITHHTRQSAVGLPKIVTRTYGGEAVDITEYTMSEIIAAVYECMERTGKTEGILFIDEINCVSETLAPTMLQFLQNKTFGSHKVPEGWLIVAAGNPPEYNKSVREFDIVTLDRVRRIDVSPDFSAWMEYAWEHQIHGAVSAYLTTKKENFYLVENREDDKAFVTARGWEDLSELMKSYEELGIPVGEKQIAEFLQKEEIAADFAAFYQIYRKYGQDYRIDAILEGTLEKSELENRISMASNGSFEERFAVVGMFLDALNGRLAKYQETDRRVHALHEALTHLKEYLNNQENMEALAGFLEMQKKSYEVRLAAELLSGAEAEREKWVQRKLGEFSLKLRERHLMDKESGFAFIKEMFQSEVQERKTKIAGIQENFARAFGFLEAAFGDGQEMVLFVTGLTENARAVEFFGKHGCPKYFQYSEKLLFRRQEQELLEACRQVLED